MPYVPPKRRFLQEPHGVTSQKTPFFIVTAVNTSNFTIVGTVHITKLSINRKQSVLFGHAVTQWVGHYATSGKIAFSMPYE
jgi:hypothetical protein